MRLQLKENTMLTQKELVLNTVVDLVSNFLYYDRKEDEDLPRGVIDDLVKNGIVTVDEIVTLFKQKLIEGLS